MKLRTDEPREWFGPGVDPENTLIPAGGEITVPDGMAVPDGWTVVEGTPWSAETDPGHIAAWLAAETAWHAEQPDSETKTKPATRPKKETQA